MSQTIGWIALTLAAMIAAMNFYLSFVRYWVYRLFRRPYHFVSGLPLFGTLCSLTALVCLWKNSVATAIVGACLLLDTLGVPWFVVIMIVASIKSRR